MPIGIIILKFILLIVFLSLSAFFSASETALFSLDSIKLKRLTKAGGDTSLIVKLLENPLRCLTAILAGNTLVNIAISAILTSVLIDLLGVRGVGVSIGVTTLILLTFGEVTPKTIAIHNNERIAYLFSGPLYVFNRIISPFLFLATRVCDAIISFFRFNLKKEPTLTEEEFKTVMEIGQRHGVVAKNEKEMVVSILELSTTTAEEIMTPRTDIKAISCAWDRERALEAARKAQRSKLPVYKDSFDNILGVIYVRDLFLEVSRPFAELLKPVLFIPATKRIGDLIRDFYRQDLRMAIVVDEYGGTSGLITLEDILEEIFGEIHKEFGMQEKMIEAVAEKKYRISGKTPLDRFSEACRVTVTSRHYDTVAGYLLEAFGRLPAEGERLETPVGVFTVEKVAGRRIKSVLLETK